MSRFTDAAETLAATARFLHETVVLNRYALGAEVSEAVARHHKAQMKSAGFLAVAQAYAAATRLCPKHPRAADWLEYQKEAETEVSFYGESADFWLEQI
jgi:hypothetical protein